MRILKNLFENNRQWAAEMRDEDPAFFEKLAAQHAPPYLWIGCSDSRVPANQIVGLADATIREAQPDAKSALRRRRRLIKKNLRKRG